MKKNLCASRLTLLLSPSYKHDGIFTYTAISDLLYSYLFIRTKPNSPSPPYTTFATE